MKQTVSIGSIVALLVVATGSSVTVFSSAPTPAKLAMFAIGIMTGILIGRLVSQRRSASSS